MICIEEECINDNILSTEYGESNLFYTEIGSPDEITHGGYGDEGCTGNLTSNAMDMGIATNNVSHVYDLSDEWVRPLDNRSLQENLNDFNSYYDKAKKKVKMIAGSMAIQMRNLVVEGANKADTLSIDAKNRICRPNV